uniref:Uncharacterized protein n=1 Tax=Sphaerodactylus townsendi TaxID=933632 RepID=A0ACB8F3X2_9SAUR
MPFLQDNSVKQFAVYPISQIQNKGWEKTVFPKHFRAVLGHRDVQRVVAKVLEVFQSSACHCLHRFLHDMLANLCPHVWFPKEEADLAPIRTEFSGFPTMEYTHITLTALCKELQVYWNLYHFHNTNVQLSCNHRIIFTDLVAKFPRSIHDA